MMGAMPCTGLRHGMILPACMCLSLLAAGCGGGEPEPLMPPQPPPPSSAGTPTPPPAPPWARVSENPSFPVFRSGGTVRIGTGAGARAEDLAGAGVRNGVSLREGRVADGTDADDVVAALRQITPDDIIFFVTFPHRPALHVVEGAGGTFREATMHAVAVVNSVLPWDRQILFDETPVAAPVAISGIPDGEIHVEHSPQSRWRGELAEWSEPSNLGISWRENASPDASLANNHVRAGWTAVNADRTLSREDLVHVLVHELLHLLGLWQHTDGERFPDSVLNAVYYGPASPFVVTELDKDLLHAAHARFGPASVFGSEITTESLGPWASESAHLTGSLDVAGGQVGFGVSARNGLVQPWTAGPAPTGSLPVSGTASWTGTFLGLGRTERKVTGDVRLDLTLSDPSSGEILFSGLEHDDGRTWHGGDLMYAVAVEAATFGNRGLAGADVGAVTGAFFGRDHEGMGGVLRREDLAGAFGGKR